MENPRQPGWVTSEPRQIRLNFNGTHAFACSRQFPDLGVVRVRPILHGISASDPSGKDAAIGPRTLAPKLYV